VTGYSILLSSAGIGATLGAIFVASLGRQRPKDHWLLVGMFIFAGFLGAAAVIPHWADAAGLSQFRLLSAAICLLGAGFGAVVFYASAMTIIQLESPDHLRGRIMGIWMIVYSGSVPIGALWTGRAAVWVGVDVVLIVSAITCMIAGVLAWATGVLRPRYRPASSVLPDPHAEGRDV
jgi:MFS family permease